MKLRIETLLILFIMLSFLSCSKSSLEPDDKPNNFKKLAKITSIDLSNDVETILWEFYYNENNKVISMVEGKNNYVVNYNSNGKLSEIVKTIDDGRTINYSFIYDALGRRTTQIEVETNKNRPDFKPTVTNSYEFDSNHKIIKSSASNVPNSYSEFVWDGENMVDWRVINSGVLSYSYKTTLNDTKNNPMFEISYVLEPVGFIWSTCRNNSLSRLTTMPDGSSTVTTFAITYNSTGYPIEVVSSSQGKILNKAKYYYLP